MNNLLPPVETLFESTIDDVLKIDLEFFFQICMICLIDRDLGHRYSIFKENTEEQAEDNRASFQNKQDKINVASGK